MDTLSTLTASLLTAISAGITVRLLLNALGMMGNPEERQNYWVKNRNALIALGVSLSASTVMWIIKSYKLFPF